MATNIVEFIVEEKTTDGQIFTAKYTEESYEDALADCKSRKDANPNHLVSIQRVTKKLLQG